MAGRTGGVAWLNLAAVAGVMLVVSVTPRVASFYCLELRKEILYFAQALLLLTYCHRIAFVREGPNGLQRWCEAFVVGQPPSQTAGISKQICQFLPSIRRMDGSVSSFG